MQLWCLHVVFTSIWVSIHHGSFTLTCFSSNVTSLMQDAAEGFATLVQFQLPFVIFY